jgi:hypothetical protein
MKWEQWQLQQPAWRSRWLPRRWLGTVAAFTAEAEDFTAAVEGFTPGVVADFVAVQ